MTLKTNKSKPKNKQLGFTIVELLIVIVIIGILAAITIVSYIGISKKATEASLTSDLDGAKRQLELYKTEHETYPTTMDANKCPTDPINDTKYCLKNKDLIYATTDNGITYVLKLTKSDITFEVTNDSTPKLAVAAPAEPTLPESDWITIGTQRWARKNLNIGVMINSSISQGDNSIIEKYCYNNNESNCSTYGGLYQWEESMDWVTKNNETACWDDWLNSGYQNSEIANCAISEGARGICPIGSHIPTSNEWKILEMYLGMTQAQADIGNGSRGTNQGTQLMEGGSSGFNALLGGYGFFDSFSNLLDETHYWTSTASTEPSAVYEIYARGFSLGDGKILNYGWGNHAKYAVRCLGD